MLPGDTEARDRSELNEFVRRFRPLRDVLLVEVEPDGFVTESGLLIDHAKIEQNDVRVGRVLACGPGEKTHKGTKPTPYTVGDRVCFERGMAYAKLRFGDVELRLLKEEQLEGFVIEGNERVDVRAVS